MAKASMRPEVKAAKLRNNKVGMLTCSTVGCETEFYIGKPCYPAKRFCPTHFLEDLHSVSEKVTSRRRKSMLFKLGLIS